MHSLLTFAHCLTPLARPARSVVAPQIWNLTLACIDSDLDGWPNGWELGDPCGNWTGGSAPTTWSTDISLPGMKSSVPKTRTLPLDWVGVCGKNPCPPAQQQQQQQQQQPAALRGASA